MVMCFIHNRTTHHDSGRKKQLVESFISDGPGEKDLASIITHQGDLPMIEVTLADGSKRRLWNTFGPEQIDINPKSPAGNRLQVILFRVVTMSCRFILKYLQRNC